MNPSIKIRQLKMLRCVNIGFLWLLRIWIYLVFYLSYFLSHISVCAKCIKYLHLSIKMYSNTAMTKCHLKVETWLRFMFKCCELNQEMSVNQCMNITTKFSPYIFWARVHTLKLEQEYEAVGPSCTSWKEVLPSHSFRSKTLRW